MSLHHVALGAQDVDRVAKFYQTYFGLAELTRFWDENDALRSVWLSIPPGILMIERSTHVAPRVDKIGKGPFLLAFSVSEAERRALEAKLARDHFDVEDRTEFTSYTRDPEGNRVAFSHHPGINEAAENPPGPAGD